MEIDPTLSIVAAAIGGLLIGWQLRADYERRRRRTPPLPRPETIDQRVDAHTSRVAVHTPQWERPVLTEAPKD